MSSQVFPAVTPYQDGADNKVKADYLNRPINQLKARTEYLKQKNDAIFGGKIYESVRLQNAALATDETPELFDIVAYDPDKSAFVKALAEGTSYPVLRYEYGLPSAYAMGILVSIDGQVGTIVTFGNCPELTGVPVAGLLEAGETFRNGPYYLSASTPGKLSSRPSGMAVYLGIFEQDSSSPLLMATAYITPVVKDLWESHLHMSFTLGGIPAGDVITETTDRVVTGFKPQEFLTGQAFDGADIPVRLKIVGSWLHSASTSIDFTLTSTDGKLGTTTLTWLSNDGLLSGSIDINLYNYAFALADTGLEAILETAEDYNSWSADVDFDVLGRIVTTTLDTSTSSIGSPVYYDGVNYQLAGVPAEQVGTVHTLATNGEVELGGFAGVTYTWRLELPEQAAGWLQHYFYEQAAYIGSNIDYDYTVLVYGRCPDDPGLGFDQLKLKVTAGSSLAYPGDATIEIYHVEDPDNPTLDVLINTVTNVSFDRPFIIIGGSGEYNLAVYITQRRAGDTPVGDTAVAAGDAWLVQLTDEQAGSDFEYNIGLDSRLAPYYPPVPITAAVLELNGVTVPTVEDFPSESMTYGTRPRTLFWMSGLAAECPFPEDWIDRLTPPSAQVRNFKLYHNSMRVAETGIVNTLTPGTGIVLKDRRTNQPATFGDLLIEASFSNSFEDVDQSGYKVIKSIRSDNVMLRGPVVEKLVQGPGVVIQKQSSDMPDGQGILQISAGATGLMQGDFSDITLLNAKQELVPGRLTSFIRLLKWTDGSSSNIPSGFIAKFRVPYSLTSTYRVIVYATMIGLADTAVAASHAGIKITYSIMQDFTKVSDPVNPQQVFRNLLQAGANGVLETEVWPETDIKIGAANGASGGGPGYTAYDPFLFHNDPGLPIVDGQVDEPWYQMPSPPTKEYLFPLATEDPAAVTSGDIVAVRFERSSPHNVGSEYTEDIGVVDIKWKLIDLAI